MQQIGIVACVPRSFLVGDLVSAKGRKMNEETQIKHLLLSGLLARLNELAETWDAADGTAAAPLDEPTTKCFRVSALTAMKRI